LRKALGTSLPPCHLQPHPSPRPRNRRLQPHRSQHHSTPPRVAVPSPSQRLQLPRSRLWCNGASRGRLSQRRRRRHLHRSKRHSTPPRVETLSSSPCLQLPCLWLRLRLRFAPPLARRQPSGSRHHPAQRCNPGPPTPRSLRHRARPQLLRQPRVVTPQAAELPGDPPRNRRALDHPSTANTAGSIAPSIWPRTRPAARRTRRDGQLPRRIGIVGRRLRGVRLWHASWPATCTQRTSPPASGRPAPLGRLHPPPTAETGRSPRPRNAKRLEDTNLLVALPTRTPEGTPLRNSAATTGPRAPLHPPAATAAPLPAAEAAAPLVPPETNGRLPLTIIGVAITAARLGPPRMPVGVTGRNAR
jgi:hypothetical protein